MALDMHLKLEGGSYHSSSNARVHVGLGPATGADVTVQWPSGRREAWTGLTPGSRVLRQGTGGGTK